MPKNLLLEQRLSRILKSVAMEKPDRIPVVLQYSGFAANAKLENVRAMVAAAMGK